MSFLNQRFVKRLTQLSDELLVQDTSAALKQAAAEAALAEVRSGMRLGLGTGSTAAFVVEGLAARLADGRLRDVAGAPTSRATAALAQKLGVPLLDLSAVRRLDLALDGADEVGPNLGLIKGGGAALLREKIIAAAADCFVVVADDSKRVDMLGAFALPVEIVDFAAPITIAAVRALLDRLRLPSDRVALRKSAAGGVYLRTDGGNLVLDLACKAIPDPEALAAGLAHIPGVVENGLFLGLAQRAYIASATGVDCVRV